MPYELSLSDGEARDRRNTPHPAMAEVRAFFETREPLGRPGPRREAAVGRRGRCHGRRAGDERRWPRPGHSTRRPARPSTGCGPCRSRTEAGTGSNATGPRSSTTTTSGPSSPPWGRAHAPDGYARGPSARLGLDRLRGYFRANPPPDLHHRTMALVGLHATRWPDGRQSSRKRRSGRSGRSSTRMAAGACPPWVTGSGGTARRTIPTRRATATARASSFSCCARPASRPPTRRSRGVVWLEAISASRAGGSHDR